MKIPDRVRINGVDYEVILTEHLNDGSHMCYGYINFEQSTIEIDPERGGHQHQCITLLHEIIHGIFHAQGMDNVENEEEIVQAISRGLYQVLQDNARKFFDLKEVGV